MTEFEDAIRAIHKASAPIAGNALVAILPLHLPTIVDHRKLHISFDHVRWQLVQKCNEWVHEASPTTAAEIHVLAEKFGQFFALD